MKATGHGFSCGAVYCTHRGGSNLFGLWVKSEVFPMVLFVVLHKVTLTFQFVEEIHLSHQSDESYSKVLSYSACCFSVSIIHYLSLRPPYQKIAQFSFLLLPLVVEDERYN